MIIETFNITDMDYIIAQEIGSVLWPENISDCDGEYQYRGQTDRKSEPFISGAHGRQETLTSGGPFGFRNTRLEIKMISPDEARKNGDQLNVRATSLAAELKDILG
ncbi:hypothetical protein Avbf_16787 [Armadillidium vulgare]|nr:hypothetical protein Avbf_16787 [Armadillidium vulgare]